MVPFNNIFLHLVDTYLRFYIVFYLLSENCTELLLYQNLPKTHDFKDFHQEVLRLSAFFHDYKLDFIPTMFSIIIIHIISITSGLLLIIAVALKRKVLLIPWLIVGEIIVVFWSAMVIVIIILESKLFESGKSVFGLFTALSLCIACVQAYLWIIVQVSPNIRS